MVEYSDPQFERIKAAFNAQEIPRVTGETLRTYFEYLKENLTCPCTLTGIESIKYFGWEARYSFGYGSKKERERLRREKGHLKTSMNWARWMMRRSMKGGIFWSMCNGYPIASDSPFRYQSCKRWTKRLSTTNCCTTMVFGLSIATSVLAGCWCWDN